MSPMPWENDPITEVAKQMPWENDPIETPARQQDIGVMPFVNAPISEILAFVPEGLADAVSYVPGVDIRGIPREYIRKGFEAIGAKLPEEGREPETIPEYLGAGVGDIEGSQ